MAIQKLPNVNGKQVGNNLNVKIEGKGVFTLTGNKEVLKPAKDALALFLEKKTKNNFENLLRLLKPKTTEIKKDLEKEIEIAKAEIKATKKAIKEKGIKVESLKAFSEEQASEIKGILKDCLKEFFEEQNKPEQLPTPTISKRGEY